jgi:hypothetical protein
MGKESLALGLEGIGLVCWVVCFTWMSRISVRQEELLKSLNEQARKIAELSKAEHDLIKEVHPQVSEIRQDVKDVAEIVGNVENAMDGEARTESEPP